MKRIASLAGSVAPAVLLSTGDARAHVTATAADTAPRQSPTLLTVIHRTRGGPPRA